MIEPVFKCEEINQARELIKKAYDSRIFPFFFKYYSYDCDMIYVFLEEGKFFIVEEFINHYIKEEARYKPLEYQNIDDLDFSFLVDIVCNSKSFKDLDYNDLVDLIETVEGHPEIISIFKSSILKEEAKSRGEVFVSPEKTKRYFDWILKVKNVPFEFSLEEEKDKKDDLSW